MTRPFTIQQIKDSPCSHLNGHLIDGVKLRHEKKSKYGNKRTEVDGIKFQSLREAKRYTALKLLLKAGNIGFLELQVKYDLNVGGTHKMAYLADFRYLDAKTGETIVEDCKGMRTAVYKKKCRLMKKLYGITIFET